MDDTRKYHPNGDSYCYECKKLRTKKDRKDNPEKTKHYSWKSRIKKFYDLTEDEYNILYLSQSGKCAICYKDMAHIDKSTHIDHDHNTGEVRGLLCHSCNTAIGLFMEDKSIMENAIKYLSEAGMKMKKGKKK